MKNRLLLVIVIFGVLKLTASDNLIPLPKELKKRSHKLKIESITNYHLPIEWGALEAQIRTFFQNSTSKKKLFPSTEELHSLFFKRNNETKPEAYKLEIKNTAIYISASDYAGAFNGFQTLKQLMHNKNSLSTLTIKDEPRFNYRGLMLDCSRHFWTIDELQKTIQQMSSYKLNKLHLHLTDNNAWRVEIKAYPKLITKGTYYKDFSELSGLYYTQQELRDLVTYAKKYNVEIIPEIDLPGHATALLAAYPEYSCNGGNFEAYPEEMPIENRKHSHANMLCIGNPEVLKFSEIVIKELQTIFPSQFIHLGGDEVPTSVWENCSKCQSLKEKQNLTDWAELQDYYTTKLRAICNQNNKTMIGWGEINDRNAASRKDVVMIWRDKGYAKATQALKREVPVIMAPQHGCYFDWGYAGNSTKKVYSWEPISKIMLETQNSNLVKGVQACLWTERVPTQKRVERMLYPRLSALAEVMWTPKNQKNWDNFLSRLEKNYAFMKNSLDINYYVDESINATEFKAQKEKPSLVRHAFLSSSVPAYGDYHLDYIFDGRNNSFYWGGRGLKKGDWYQLQLGEPVSVKHLKIISGDSKDYIEKAEIKVSKDGKSYKKVAEFDPYGEANASLNNEVIKFIRIEVTKAQKSWPILREVVIK